MSNTTKTPLYQHQIEDVARLLKHESFGLFSEMGTGKSAIVVHAACELRKSGAIAAVLVVCPAAVRGVWCNPDFGEIKKHHIVPSAVYEFHNPSRMTWQDSCDKSQELLSWLVTNYEFLRGEEHQEKLLSILHNQRFMMVMDESSYVKSRSAVQTKACQRIAKLATRRVILNGTPIANNPLDLWAQMNLLSPRILPYKNFFHFRSEFAVLGGWHNKQILSFKHLDKLQEHVAPYVIRREKKDCLDLPEKIFTQREVSLGESTWLTYKRMRDEAVVWLDENPSMAAQAGVKVMRLAQITSGFLGGFIEEEGADAPATLPKDISREKLDFLLEYVKERLDERPDLKIIVWCRFRAELERVAEELKKLLPTYRLYGQAKSERAASVARFSDPGDKSPGLLAAQPQAGGFGLNLVAADHVVYLSNDFSLMTRLQSEDRCHRPGQVNKVLYLDVLATGPKGQRSVDHHILKALRSKGEIATWTCAAWKKVLQEE